MNVAVIPARGGSKRIPRKNIRRFCGKPLIAWSIEAALSARCFDRVIVSTEDDEIMTVARESGAEVPFRRPEELSDDHAGTVAVMQQAVAWLQDNGWAPARACCIYATAPFVTAPDLQRGQEILDAADGAYAVSVTAFEFPIQRAVCLRDDGGLAMFWPEHRETRSQDLEEAYHDAAQFYWGHAWAWRAAERLFGEQTAPVLVPRHRVQDIDTPKDWERAELMFQAMYPEYRQ